MIDYPPNPLAQISLHGTVDMKLSRTENSGTPAIGQILDTRNPRYARYAPWGCTLRERQRLRIEEVLTFDFRRLSADTDMSQWMEDVFDNIKTLITDEMLERRLVYRLENWKAYFDKYLRRELRLLALIARDDYLSAIQ